MARQTRKSKAGTSAGAPQDADSPQDVDVSQEAIVQPDAAGQEVHSTDFSDFGAEHPQDELNTINAQTDASDSASAVNAQIEATVALLNQQVCENPSDLARVGLELATSQSLSIAVQDAVDHVRRMQVLAEATHARAALPGASKDDASAASATQAGVDAAMQTLQRVTDLARAGTTPGN